MLSTTDMFLWIFVLCSRAISTIIGAIWAILIPSSLLTVLTWCFIGAGSDRSGAGCKGRCPHFSFCRMPFCALLRTAGAPPLALQVNAYDARSIQDLVVRLAVGIVIAALISVIDKISSSA